MAYNDAPQPKAFSVTVNGGSGFAGANLVTIPGFAQFTMIQNLSNQNVQVKLNGDSACVFTLLGESLMNFNRQEAEVKTVDFANNASGATTANVQIIVGVSVG